MGQPFPLARESLRETGAGRPTVVSSAAMAAGNLAASARAVGMRERFKCAPKSLKDNLTGTLDETSGHRMTFRKRLSMGVEAVSTDLDGECLPPNFWMNLSVKRRAFNNLSRLP